MADWGLLRLYPGVLLQSAFGDFLRSRLGEKASLRGAIEMAFEQYCDKILKTDFAIQAEMSNQNKEVKVCSPPIDLVAHFERVDDQSSDIRVEVDKIIIACVGGIPGLIALNDGTPWMLLFSIGILIMEIFFPRISTNEFLIPTLIRIGFYSSYIISFCFYFISSEYLSSLPNFFEIEPWLNDKGSSLFSFNTIMWIIKFTFIATVLLMLKTVYGDVKSLGNMIRGINL